MFLEELAKNKALAYIFVALCLGIFLIGFAMITTAKNQVNTAVNECNIYYQNQLKNKPSFSIPDDLPTIFNLTEDYTK